MTAPGPVGVTMRRASAVLETEVFDRIAERAEAVDAGRAHIVEDIDDLRRQGLGLAPLPRAAGGRGLANDPAATAECLDVLRRLGAANLSVARLYEGHLNAIKLISLYGSPRQKADMARRVTAGDWMGVWGADGPDPVRWDATTARLSGGKAFASGLGIVGHAVISFPAATGVQLAVVDASDPSRADPSSWQVTGMRATLSGRYCFDGLHLPEEHLLGRPGDYLREPWFEGGVWRYCAAHLGAAEAIFETTMDHLAGRGRAPDPHQLHRLARMAIDCETARHWVETAAVRVETARADPQQAAYALLARDAVETACTDLMDRAERAIGTAAHASCSKVNRICRDLRLYLRQAALDDKLERAGQRLLDRHVLPRTL